MEVTDTAGIDLWAEGLSKQHFEQQRKEQEAKEEQERLANDRRRREATTALQQVMEEWGVPIDVTDREVNLGYATIGIETPADSCGLRKDTTVNLHVGDGRYKLNINEYDRKLFAIHLYAARQKWLAAKEEVSVNE